MNSTPRQRRSEHRARTGAMVDMNLVSLIDVFTILIFFLLSNATGVELLPSSKAIALPLSSAEQSPRETIVLMVNDEEILVEGRKVAAVAEVLASSEDLIPALQAELTVQAARQAVRAENQAQIQVRGKAITIMGDKAIPYRLLRKVMFTCARAEFSDVSFAVRRRDDT